MSRGEWKGKLVSNDPLFELSHTPLPSNVKGPHVTETGQVVGDVLSTEIDVFTDVAHPDQQKFFEELTTPNYPAAIEYVLTITGALAVWKDDIKALEFVLEVISRGEAAIRNEEHLIKEAEAIHKDTKLSEILQRHIPGISEKIDIKMLQFDSLLNQLKTLETTLKPIEKELRVNLRQKRKELPFLFED